MMIIACIFCVLGGYTITHIIQNFSDSSGLGAFLLSWVAIMAAAIALQIKEGVLRQRRIPGLIKIIGGACTIFALYPAIMAFKDTWQQSSGFWAKMLLVWLAILAYIQLWVIFQAAEEGRPAPPQPPPSSV